MYLLALLRHKCSGMARPLAAGAAGAVFLAQLLALLSLVEPGAGSREASGRAPAALPAPIPVQPRASRSARRGRTPVPWAGGESPEAYVRPGGGEVDLVARVGRNLELPASRDEAVDREFYRYAVNADGLNRILRRSERYLSHIVETIERHGMPLDVALLPIVESSYNPYARSGKQAAGLWQIIPGTGRELGLVQNSWYDARFDVIESTEAALTYLRQLHAQFGGDWLLALAGYNAGGAAVESAVRRAEAARAPTDFWGIRPWLPEETRTYVARMLALARLFADPGRYGVALRAVPDRPRFRVIPTGGQVDLDQVAFAAGIGADELYWLNPGLNRGSTAPNGPHRLLVPFESTEQVAAVFAAGSAGQGGVGAAPAGR